MSEGEYGHVQDWQGDIQRDGILNHPSLSRSPDLQSWIRDKHKDFENILEGFGRVREEVTRTDTVTQGAAETCYSGVKSGIRSRAGEAAWNQWSMTSLRPLKEKPPAL